uniref:hypothetical protein n=1 Tax=Pseudomonas viridiflava TaxID=33069 RepID=UPI0019812206
MTNSPARPESLGEYLAHLPLGDAQRAELADCTALTQLHERLSGRPAHDAVLGAQNSVEQRL